MKIESFDTVEEMFASIQADRVAADARVGPDSTQYKAGTGYVRAMPELGIIVYGEILDPIQSEIDAGADEGEVEYQRAMRDRPEMKHFRFTRSYSVMCPDGEYGDVHVSCMHIPLTPEEFSRARDLEWPTDALTLFEGVLHLPWPPTGVA